MTAPDPREVVLWTDEQDLWMVEDGLEHHRGLKKYAALPAAQHAALVAELDGYRAGLGRVRNEALAYMGATTPQNPIERILRLCDMASEALGIPHPPEEIA